MKKFYIIALCILGLSLGANAVNKVADLTTASDLLYCKSPIIGNQEFTLEMWVKGTMGGGTHGRLFSHRVGNPYVFEVSAGDGNLKVYYGGWRTTTGTGLNDNKWHHVAVAKGTDSLSVYLDGTEVYKKKAPLLNFSPSENIAFGGNSTGLIASENVSAQFDEIRIWDHERSAQDIGTKMDEKINPLSTGLLAYYTFDGSTELKDVTFNGRDLSKKSLVTYPEADYDYIKDYGLNMDGNDDYISMPTPITGTNTFTLEAQFKTSATGAYLRVFGWTGYDFEVAFRQGYLYYYKGTWKNISTTLYNDDKWHHIAVTNDGTNLRFYVDGELIKTTADKPNLSGTMYVGDGYTNAGNFKGEMDEVRVWGVVRTQAELQSNASKELQGDETNLVAYFDMNTVSTDVINVAGGTNMTRTGVAGNNNKPQYVEVMKTFVILATANTSFAEETAFTVYPNPTTDGIVHFSEELNQVEIYTFTGVKVLEGNNVTSISLDTLKKGVYLIKTEKGTQKINVE